MLKIILKALLLFNSFSVCKPYIISPITIQRPSLKNNNNDLKQLNMISNEANSLLCKYTDLLDYDKSQFLVKKMSNIFPQLDSISHFVLNTNNQLVTAVLENDHLKVETKKFLVLMIIQFTQNGDSTGSHILQFYHDLVQCLL